MHSKKTRRERFFELYKKELVPKFKEYEKLRIKELRKVQLAIVFSIIGILCFFILLYISIQKIYINGFESFVLLWHLLLIVTAFFVCNAGAKPKQFSELVKKKFLPLILNVLGDIKTGTTTTTYIDINKSNLFPDFDNVDYGDVFHGIYRGVNYEIAEVRLTKRVRTKHGMRNAQVFKGVMLKFVSNKNFNGQVKILSRKDFNTRFGQPLLFVISFVYMLWSLFQHSIMIAIFTFVITMFIIFASDKRRVKMQKVSLEDPEICKNYIVDATDQVEARYLLTPSFISKFNKLQTAFGTKNLRCAFFENTIMFAVESSKDFFEIANINKSMNSPEMVIKFYHEIIAIHNLIKHFNFDKKLGL